MEQLNEQVGLLVLCGGSAFLLAVLSSKLSRLLRLPAPGFFLVAAALLSAVEPRLRDLVSTRDLAQIVSVALIFILFDGGMDVGWARFRKAAAPIVVLGVVGTFATAGLSTVAAHYLLSLDWVTSALIGVAVSPTDPAVVFSVLGKWNVVGRTGVILKGESGFNDPVGIALMIGVLAYAGDAGGDPLTVVTLFCEQMAIGLAVGVLGGWLLAALMRRVPLPSEALYPLRTMASALIIFGVAAEAHGSGFLAVLVAGMLVGDVAAPYKAETVRVHGSVAALAEIIVFIGLGLNVDVASLGSRNAWLAGLVLSLVVTIVIRPAVVLPLLRTVRLQRGEKLFIVWGGLKGAVPILLGAFAVLENVKDASYVYSVVLVVVLFSVLVQGATTPWTARALKVPIALVEPEPWHVTVRLREQPEDVARVVVERASAAEGCAVRDLPLGDGRSVAFVIREGRLVAAGASCLLQTGDELLLLEDVNAPGQPPHHLFTRAPDGPSKA